MLQTRFFFSRISLTILPGDVQMIGIIFFWGGGIFCVSPHEGNWNLLAFFAPASNSSFFHEPRKKKKRNCSSQMLSTSMTIWSVWTPRGVQLGARLIVSNSSSRGFRTLIDSQSLSRAKTFFPDGRQTWCRTMSSGTGKPQVLRNNWVKSRKDVPVFSFLFWGFLAIKIQTLLE